MNSNSHPATRQDLWVLENSDGPGVFVELGAYDGLTHSNTKLLEENGWTGVLIEGHRPYAEMCQFNRPYTKVVNAFVGDGTKNEVVVGGQYTGLWSTMPAAFKTEHLKRNNPFYEVETKRLSSVLGGLTAIGYLSLDTEGNEEEILSGWFRDGGRCRLLTVEFRYDGDLLHRLQRLCEDNGMELKEIRGFDACFVAKAW